MIFIFITMTTNSEMKYRLFFQAFILIIPLFGCANRRGYDAFLYDENTKTFFNTKNAKYHNPKDDTYYGFVTGYKRKRDEPIFLYDSGMKMYFNTKTGEYIDSIRNIKYGSVTDTPHYNQGTTAEYRRNRDQIVIDSDADYKADRVPSTNPYKIGYSGPITRQRIQTNRILQDIERAGGVKVKP